MTQVSTDLRQTRESAKRIRFEPAGAITATNVQDAIQQAGSIAGGVIVPTAVTVAMSPYTVLPSDRVLLVNTSAGAVTINMMTAAARNGLDITVKDDTGNAAANPISVVRNGADTIDGLPTYPMDGNYAAARFIPQAGGYYVGP